MKLELNYLRERHELWKREIGEAGIWDAALFQPVEIRIRPKCKSYNGIFSRKWTVKKGERLITDRIFIYNNASDFDPIFIDSVLVHEMIHQYIIQNNIKDSSTHGKLFKDFMVKINSTFPDQLKIRLKDHNPAIPLKGPGLTIHNIILSWTDKDFYCFIIHPKRLSDFDKRIKRYKKTGVVKGFTWAQSVDVHFDNYVRCTKTLHGIKKPLRDMMSFCKEFNVIEIGEKWLTLRNLR